MTRAEAERSRPLIKNAVSALDSTDVATIEAVIRIAEE